MKTHCTATTRAGTPCRAWAVPGSRPPRCAAHGGATTPPGAPPGNKNAQTHGFYSATSGLDAATPNIDAIIADLYARQQALSDYLTAAHDDEETTIEKLIPVFTLHAQNASRLGRLLRDKRALTGEAADGIAGAIAQALDELSTELGTPL